MIDISNKLSADLDFARIDLYYHSNEIYFAGANSHPAGSYVYVMSLLHLLHVFAGIILLLYNLSQFYRKKFSSNNTLTLNLTKMYWNFVDILWIYILVFLLLVK